MDLYEYLIHIAEKEFNRESMKAFKSLKAYKYFEDRLVRTMRGTMAVIRCHCFSSLKSKSTYTFYVAIMSTGKVVGASCSCVAGKGGACSHVAALMFYFEDFIKKGTKVVPNDGTVTDRLQQWHVPPKRVITPQPLENIQFKKAQYGKTTRRSSCRSIASPV